MSSGARLGLSGNSNDQTNVDVDLDWPARAAATAGRNQQLTMHCFRVSPQIDPHAVGGGEGGSGGT